MLKAWIKCSTPECRKIVHGVLSSHPKGNGGVSTQEIYDLAIKQFPDARSAAPPEKFYPPGSKGRGGKIPMPVPQPPNREHPIRSMRYLKKIVLEDMVERNEVEKVYIRRGMLNEDGERLDLVVSKTAGREYRADVLNGKTHMWAWRLRRPGDTMDVLDMGKPPRRHLSRPREPESRPLSPHTHEAQSALPHARQSTLPPNSETTPDEEYSRKRGKDFRLPRFHMSWGARWKGKLGVRSIHLASASQSQLNGQDLPNHSFPISQLSNVDVNHPVSRNKYATDWEEESKDGSRSRIIDQLPRQHFDRPREAESLDNSGFGLCRAQPNQTNINRDDFTSITQRDSNLQNVDHQKDANTSSDSGEWYGLVSRAVPYQTRFFKPSEKVNPTRMDSFGVRGVQNQNARNLGSSVSRTVIREVRPRIHEQDNIDFGLKRSRPSLDGDNHPDSIRARTSTEPSKPPVSPNRPESKLLEEETGFGLKRSLQDRGRNGSNSSATHVLREPISRERFWSDAMEQYMPFDLKHPPRNEHHSHTTSPANRASDKKCQMSQSFNRPREYASTNRDMRSGGVWESLGLKKPRSPHQTDVQGDVSTHTVNQQTSQPVSSSEHYEGAFNRGEAHRCDRALGWNRSQSDEVISTPHASPEPAKQLKSDWDSSHRLRCSVDKKKSAMDRNSGHAWEKASLKILLQAGKPEGKAVEFSARDINQIFPRASDSSQWRRDPPSEMSPARRPDMSTSERSIVDSSTGDANHLQRSPSDSPQWYRISDNGMWTSCFPEESSNTSSDSSPTRKPDVPFGQRLQQSRAAITKQVHEQLNSSAMPVQSAIGRLPLYQSLNNDRQQQSTQTIVAARPRQPHVICAMVDSSEQQPQEQPSDTESFVSQHKPSSVAEKTYEFPSFPTVPL